MRTRTSYTKIATSAKAGSDSLLPSLTLRKPCLDRDDRGTVILVSLCFVAVLGIMLAGYLALTSRVMNLSNRSFQSDLSRQLAEAGIEEALRAFNKNLLSGTDTTATLADWTGSNTAVNWTLDTANKRARATINFASNKFGQGVTASVKVRVDNYDAPTLDAAWISTANYRQGNMVGHTDGRWYRAISTSLNKAPTVSTSNITYWTQESSEVSSSMTWIEGTSYSTHNMVQRNGTWYRANSSHTATTSNRPPSTSWTTVPNVTADADLKYVADSIVNYYGNWYRYTGSGWDGPLPTSANGWSLTWRWTSWTWYPEGHLIFQGNVWYRCRVAHSSGTFSTTNWDTATTLSNAAGTTYWPWSSSESYNIGDVVYRASRWYRARLANNNQTPGTSSAYWSAYPQSSNDWDSNRQYNQNDVVSYNGVWYLSLLNTNTGQNPATASGYWVGANTANTAYIWNSNAAYAAGAYRCYGDVWYRCLSANTGISPNNTTYWTPAWSQGSGLTTGAPVVYAEATVVLGDNTTSVTQLRASIAPTGLFRNALAASATISVSGSSATIDSYDSVTDPAAASTGFSAVVAAGAASGVAVSLGNGTNVKGYVSANSSSTSPYAPLASFGTSATVKGSSSPISPNVDVSRISRSPYIPNPAVVDVPYYTTLSDPNAWSWAGNRLGYAGATTPAVYTVAGNLTLDNWSEYITVQGPVVLDIQGDLLIQSSSTARILISETGSLRIHVSGRLRIDASGGGIVNQTLDPKKCIIISSATTGSHNFSTATSFHGVIYMPGEDLDINATTATIYGAVSARNISVTGNLVLHYDTSLRHAIIPGVDQPYTATQWRELDASEQATMP